MNIQESLYLQWLSKQERLGTIHYKQQRRSRKSHTCERCDCEIHPGEFVWWYKPYPILNFRTNKKVARKWKTRCINCEPLKYNEYELYCEENKIH